ncbi:4,5-dihydroxyphthalate decarboxylase [Brevirhabdus pacifica]|uniref:4,5-dihydroxyphthalate decarboxylase n=1 Tax=Brevirhabdus pacifica TaxID=1267768 RepID=A0A1U7DLF3_9RHOB|nr:4,5-dihydroxyphthalate decarboxylase [Brevirhabdus pacifica]APX90826.1 4,5-dihydroxyphthalate decarboxylase [Brevirhabdus pacifica]OWU79603.1 4,5-dihydroxyphthalate decarboxylase [Loktanella sp. 22II-4b]PJJ87286.1 4,5-dihydroxyphthalate decarboxylase [Brevirhabdus pacifica]
MRKTINFGCWDYDRMAPIMDGRVRPQGIDLNFLNMPVEETFFRMLRNQEFEASELSLSSYVVSLHKPERPFVAIPVFPSRFFRHSSIYVNADSGIDRPEDLVGKRVGCPEYQMTAPVWIRGILSDDFGVNVDSVTYYTGGEEEPNRSEKLKLDLPDNIKVVPIGPDKTLSQMLHDGEIDALYTARKPSTYSGPNGKVRRLFENFPEVEKAYFARTGIFPIMHTVGIRRADYEADPWICQSLLKAFSEAKDITMQSLSETAALKAMLPWAAAHFEEAQATLGPDYWPYGFDRNRETIATFLRYSHEQGLSPRILEPEEIFAKETLEAFVI